MSGKIKLVNKESFEEDVLNSGLPVLIDFYATWCGPCRSMEPILEDVAQEMQGKAVLCKIDVDENDELANRFGIRSVPTMLIFFKGEVVERIIGITAKREILEKLNNIG